jgi:Family of unknown function (DUF6529)
MATANLRRRQSSASGVLLAFVAGAAVAIALGVYGRVHEPTDRAVTTFGFANLIEMKLWLATIASIFVVVQLVSALWMYRRLPIPMPPPTWIGSLHRLSGTVALILSLPVAFHCLWSIGFRGYDGRVFIHSLAGCLFYGVFVIKVISLHFRTMPRWLTPIAGGLLFTLFVIVFSTSALWYFTQVGWPSTSTY